MVNVYNVSPKIQNIRREQVDIAIAVAAVMMMLMMRRVFIRSHSHNILYIDIMICS